MAATEWHCDCVIIGAGIAGLWLLARLHQAGFDALLIESDKVGSGQTLCSQGIIHGGVKYSLSGRLSDATRAISAMPQRWQDCLRGSGELDLSSAHVLSQQQYLLTSSSIGSRLSGMFASRVLQSPIQRIAEGDHPSALQTCAFQGQVYRLQEPILQIDSVLRALLGQVPGASVLQGTLKQHDKHNVYLSNGTQELHLQTRQVIWTAGAGNAAPNPSSQQIRPLHMVLARGAQARGELPELYAHWVGVSDKPRLTITTHSDKQNRRVWYIGGQLAEEGVALSRAEQITQARAELNALLPWLDWSMIEFTTLRINRAEGRQPNGKRPDLPVVQEQDGVLLAWPTKLALAPLLVDQVLEFLHAAHIKPSQTSATSTLDWPQPALADYPWEWDLPWI